nr:sulfatase-like hydrolase/transferase [Cyclobacterium salsum]
MRIIWDTEISTSKIPTPHLDQLASEGMRFTNAHSSSGICSPSRYALLTGTYHWRRQKWTS